MKKSEKFVAAFLTVLFLFAVLRFFSPDPAKDQKPIEEHLQPSRPEKKMESPDSPPEKLLEKPQAVSPQAQSKKTPQAEKELSSDEQRLALFKQPSDFVYYKIKNGLALVGGDLVLGELGEDQDEEALEGQLLKDRPSRSKLWPSSEIAFGFAPGFPLDLKKEVLGAVEHFNQETVLNFFLAEEGVDQDVVVFKLREEAPCSSYLGRVGGLQPIYLNSRCDAQDVLHEMMHALGFVHEQQRENRDEHLQILWENIDPEYRFNFSILPDSMVHPYEGSVFSLSLDSVMMYPETAFAHPGTKSMKSRTQKEINPINKGLAPIDKERLQFLYGG